MATGAFELGPGKRDVALDRGANRLTGGLDPFAIHVLAPFSLGLGGWGLGSRSAHPHAHRDQQGSGDTERERAPRCEAAPEVQSGARDRTHRAISLRYSATNSAALMKPLSRIQGSVGEARRKVMGWCCILFS